MPVDTSLREVRKWQETSRSLKHGDKVTMIRKIPKGTSGTWESSVVLWKARTVLLAKFYLAYSIECLGVPCLSWFV